MKIGQKIKRLRQEKGLTQEELATRSELSKGFISQLERDLTSPSLTTLDDILECLGTSLKDFFNDYEDERIVFSENDFYTSEDTALGYKLEWIIPNAQKNLMEPIMLTLQPGGQYKEENAHFGEEFGYVLSGEITIQWGSKKYKAKKGDTFSYNANKNHNILNTGKSPAKFIWVSSPPAF